MTKKGKESNKVMNGVDSLWDSWLNGVKKLNDMQNDFEKESFKAFRNLEELISPTRDMLKNIEKDSVAITKDMTQKLQETIQTNPDDQTASLRSNWLNQVEKVSDHTQRLLWRSNHSIYDFISNSHTQLSTNMESVLDKQQKGRSEIVNTIETLVNQIKETQKTVAKAN